MSSVKFPQREGTLAAGGRKPSAVGQVRQRNASGEVGGVSAEQCQ